MEKILISISVVYSTYLVLTTYFTNYETEGFRSQNNPKNLDPSFKMDLNSGGLFEEQTLPNS